jgi:hypothetical protein
MAVLHDYYCSEHGIFESMQEKCPMKHCKGELSLVFLKPVGFKSDATKNADKNIAGLAKDFGMTDIKSTREGEHQSGYITRKNDNSREEKEARDLAEQQFHPRDNAIWGDAGFRGMSMGAIMAGQAAQSVNGEAVGLNPTTAGLPKVKPSVVINDHENLQIK